MIEGWQEDPRRRKAAETCIERASELAEGERNHGTFRWAAALRKAVTTEEQWEHYKARLLDALPYGPSSNGKPPFTRSEAKATVRSVERSQSLGEWEPGPLGDETPVRRELMGLLWHVWAQPWKGKTGNRNFVVLLAVIHLGIKANSTTVSFSSRQLAEKVKPTAKTVALALRELREEGWLKLEARGKSITDAPTYRIVLELSDSDYTSTTHSLLCKPSVVAPRHLIFDFLGDSAYRVWVLLEDGATAKDIMQLTGLSRSTIYLALQKLESAGMATRKDGRWYRVETDLDYLAQYHGVDETRAKRKAQHLVDRTNRAVNYERWKELNEARKT
jgi:predicted transcriptional regulator